MNTQIEMNNKTADFVDLFIETKDDGHDFFYYKDWVREQNDKGTANMPTRADTDSVVEYVMQDLYCSENYHNYMIDEDDEELAAELIELYMTDDDFREAAKQAAYEYIIDVDLEFENN